MGIFSKQNLGLGLELGENSVKAVLLEQNGGRAVIRRTLYLNRQYEGFLNEQEMKQAFTEWLEEEDSGRWPAACNLPQHLTLEAVYDFPPEIRRGNLRKMVDFQTQSLCGITEEAFICGDQKLASREDGRNRILIAASRELIVERCYQKFMETGVDVRIMAENGQALANAFIDFYPEEFQRDALQMILNIGRSSTSAVLFRGGHLLYVTGFTVGGEVFTRVLMQFLQCDEYQAEKEMRSFEADWTNPKSPFYRAMRSFVGEINSVLEHWKQNGSPVSDTESGELEKIWLTGGGALQKGFAQRISSLLDCKADCFGVPRRMLKNSGADFPGEEEFHPHLTLAYGLALQAVGCSMLKISLIPRHLEKKLQHLRDFPCLCAGVLCLLAILLTMLCSWTSSLNQRIAALERHRDALLQCRKIVPEIEQTQAELKLRCRRMLPLLEYGRRSHLFVQALVNCQRVLREPSQEKLTAWGIYLADEFSFMADHGLMHSEENFKGQPSEEMQTSFRNPSDGKEYTVGNSGFSKISSGAVSGGFCLVDSLPRLGRMYLGGITAQNESRFETLKKIQANFTSEQLFANVDDYTDFYQEKFLADDPGSWKKFLEKQQAQLTSQFTIFLLQLPFQEEVSD